MLVPTTSPMPLVGVLVETVVVASIDTVAATVEASIVGIAVVADMVATAGYDGKITQPG